MLHRRKLIFLIALAGSIALHALMIGGVARLKVSPGAWLGLLRAQSNQDRPEEKFTVLLSDPALAPTPAEPDEKHPDKKPDAGQPKPAAHKTKLPDEKPTDRKPEVPKPAAPPRVAVKPVPPKVNEFPEEMGERTGKATGSNASHGDEPLKGQKADEDQAQLSRNPTAPGRRGIVNSDWMSSPGDNGHGGHAGAPSPQASPARPPAPAVASIQPAPATPPAPPKLAPPRPTPPGQPATPTLARAQAPDRSPSPPREPAPSLAESAQPSQASAQPSPTLPQPIAPTDAAVAVNLRGPVPAAKPDKGDQVDGTGPRTDSPAPARPALHPPTPPPLPRVVIAPPGPPAPPPRIGVESSDDLAAHRSAGPASAAGDPTRLGQGVVGVRDDRRSPSTPPAGLTIARLTPDASSDPGHRDWSEALSLTPTPETHPQGSSVGLDLSEPPPPPAFAMVVAPTPRTPPDLSRHAPAAPALNAVPTPTARPGADPKEQARIDHQAAPPPPSQPPAPRYPPAPPIPTAAVADATYPPAPPLQPESSGAASAALAPATGDGRRPGADHPSRDPAQRSDSDSDAFTKDGGAVFRDGRLDVRFGRKIKTTRPQIPVAGLIDLSTLPNPNVSLKVNIDATGAVTSVTLAHTSGSNTVDQACRVAMYNWWFEPLRDAQGRDIPDCVLFTIGFR